MNTTDYDDDIQLVEDVKEKRVLIPRYDPTVTDEHIVGCWLDWIEKA